MLRLIRLLTKAKYYLPPKQFLKVLALGLATNVAMVFALDSWTDDVADNLGIWPPVIFMIGFILGVASIFIGEFVGFWIWGNGKALAQAKEALEENRKNKGSD